MSEPTREQHATLERLAEQHDSVLVVEWTSLGALLATCLDDVRPCEAHDAYLHPCGACRADVSLRLVVLPDGSTRGV